MRIGLNSLEYMAMKSSISTTLVKYASTITLKIGPHRPEILNVFFSHNKKGCQDIYMGRGYRNSCWCGWCKKTINSMQRTTGRTCFYPIHSINWR